MKHGGGRGLRRDASELSPAFCGGLIEALLISLFLFGFSALSPAFCGGLIEAIWSSATAAPWRCTFPRVLRGPH